VPENPKLAALRGDVESSPLFPWSKYETFGRRGVERIYRVAYAIAKVLNEKQPGDPISLERLNTREEMDRLMDRLTIGFSVPTPTTRELNALKKSGVIQAMQDLSSELGMDSNDYYGDSGLEKILIKMAEAAPPGPSRTALIGNMEKSWGFSKFDGEQVRAGKPAALRRFYRGLYAVSHLLGDGKPLLDPEKPLDLKGFGLLSSRLKAHEAEGSPWLLVPALSERNEALFSNPENGALAAIKEEGTRLHFKADYGSLQTLEVARSMVESVLKRYPKEQILLGLKKSLEDPKTSRWSPHDERNSDRLYRVAYTLASLLNRKLGGHLDLKELSSRTEMQALLDTINVGYPIPHVTDRELAKLVDNGALAELRAQGHRLGIELLNEDGARRILSALAAKLPAGGEKKQLVSLLTDGWNWQKTDGTGAFYETRTAPTRRLYRALYALLSAKAGKPVEPEAPLDPKALIALANSL